MVAWRLAREERIEAVGVLKGDRTVTYRLLDSTISLQMDSLTDEYRDIVLTSLKETPPPMKNDPFEGAGHYRPLHREKRERDFGKKRHARSKQVKKSRARNRRNKHD